MNSPLPRDDYRIGPAASSYPRRHRSAAADVLKLHEVVVLRRLQLGYTQVEAARALGMTKGQVTSMTRYLRVRFGVDTNEELLALPRVQEQLAEGGAA